MKHWVTTVNDLHSRKIDLKVLAGAGAQIDTTTENGLLFFADLAEFERELIVERTQAGLSAARARGRQGGWPRRMDRATVMTAMTDSKANACDVARQLGMTTMTLYVY